MIQLTEAEHAALTARNVEYDAISTHLKNLGYWIGHDLLSAVAHLLALHATAQVDASRYRGMRLVVTEPNESVQERFMTAIDALLPDDVKTVPTPDEVDKYVDQIVATCGAVLLCS